MSFVARTNVLAQMTNPDLIEFVLEDPEASEAALELAERLQYAIDELDRMSGVLAKMEAARGDS